VITDPICAEPSSTAGVPIVVDDPRTVRGEISARVYGTDENPPIGGAHAALGARDRAPSPRRSRVEPPAPTRAVPDPPDSTPDSDPARPDLARPA
jgi:hypothetical protein